MNKVVINNIGDRIKIYSCVIFVFVFSYHQLHAPTPLWLDPATAMDMLTLHAIKNAPQEEIDMFDQNGYTGLMLAALNGYTEAVKVFLSRGANASLRSPSKAEATTAYNFQGNTALHLAMIGADYAATCLDVAKLLVESGVPVFVRNDRGRTPLHMVNFLLNNFKDRMEITDFLIAHGAQVNAQDSFGNTMLHNLVQSWERDWIATFREKYGNFVDPGIKNNLGNTAYQEAVRLMFDDDLDSVGASLQKKFPRIGEGALGFLDTDKEGRTALMFSLYRGNIGEAKKYVAAGTNVNAKDNKGMTPLHYAMLSVRPAEAVEYILSTNPTTINVADLTFGNTPLLMVAKIEHSGDRQRVLQLLLDKGADINAKDKKGNTLLDIIKQQDRLGFKDQGMIDKLTTLLKNKK